MITALLVGSALLLGYGIKALAPFLPPEDAHDWWIAGCDGKNFSCSHPECKRAWVLGKVVVHENGDVFVDGVRLGGAALPYAQLVKHVQLARAALESWQS